MKAVLTFTDDGPRVRASLSFDPPIKRADFDQPATPAIAMAFEALLSVRDHCGEVELQDRELAKDLPGGAQ